MMGDILIPVDWVDQKNIIKVIGVGGGGGNAVNSMFKMGITGVDFMICNTDAQVLNASPIPEKIQLGESITRGLGAGLDPIKGKNAAIESSDAIKASLGGGTEMLFITAGMGGGTGTGAAPVIAELAKDLGILTVAVVTYPFRDEGVEFLIRANDGIDKLSKVVDSILIVDNEKIYSIFGDLPLLEGFAKADDVLSTAVKGIAEIITLPSHINVDLADLRKVMINSGVTLLGTGKAEGDDRATQAVAKALESPLLNDFNLKSAKNVLVNVSTSREDSLRMRELEQALQYIREYTGNNELAFKRGVTFDDSLGEAINITIVATGFEMKTLPHISSERDSDSNVVVIGENLPTDSSPNIESGQLDREIEFAPTRTVIDQFTSAPSFRENLKKKEVPALIIEEGEDITFYQEIPAYIRREVQLGDDNKESGRDRIQYKMED